MVKPSFLLFLLACFFIFSCQNSPQKLSETPPAFQLQEGDLLFQDEDCGPFCEAIEAVTEGVYGYEFSHIGLVLQDKNGDLKVMEAITKGVMLTPLDSFLNRTFDKNGHPKVIVGRLKSEYQKEWIPKAIDFIHSKMNAPYDFEFVIDNDSYYCSELIHLAFQDANQGKPIFETPPMTFKAPNTDSTFAIWVDYYKKLGKPIPEGKVGLNPGSMSRSPFIEIVHHFGEPSKEI
jgi:hypothetical protein